MGKHYQDAIYLRDGRILLYKNSQTKHKANWQMRVLRPDGGYETGSTRTPNLGEASRIAEDLLDDMRQRHRDGAPVSDIRFRELHQRWWRVEGQNIRTPKRRSLVTSQFELYFLPFFGERFINSITTNTMSDFWVWRLDYWKTGPGVHLKGKVVTYAETPSVTTLKGELSTFMRVMRWAHEHGMIRKLPLTRVPLPSLHASETARPAFTETETRAIRNWIMEQNLKPYHHYPNDYGARMFRNYVRMGLASGMRPNELFSLKWRMIQRKVDGNFIFYVVQVPKQTKTGARTTIPLPDHFASALDDLRMFSKFQEPDDYVFTTWTGGRIRDYIKQFHAMTEALGIQVDHNGDRRVPYSMRHTYITHRLLNNVSKDDLARNVGNSVEEIDAHYDHVLNEQRAQELTANKSVVEQAYDEALGKLLRRS